MPIHKLQEVRSLVVEDAWELATRRCQRDVQSLGMGRSDVRAMLLALAHDDYTKEFGPVESDYGAIQADVYRLWYDVDAQLRCSPHNGQCLRIKLGIHAAGESGCRVLVSLHLDKRP